MGKSALLVGINYIGSNIELKGCLNDVVALEKVLKKRGFTCKVLTDHTEVKPTCANIKKELLALVTNAKAGDILYWGYSGHGSTLPDPTLQEALDSVYIPLDYKTGGVIRDTFVFNEICKKVPKGVTMFSVNDACHSSSILDLKCTAKSQCKRKSGTEKKYDPSEWSEKYVFEVNKSPELESCVIALSASADTERAKDAVFNGVANGAFTKCLLETLENKPEISILELLTQVNIRLDLSGFTTQDSQLSLSSMKFINTKFLESA
jgi:metacaspase-1